jgi:hypothetical protein
MTRYNFDNCKNYPILRLSEITEESMSSSPFILPNTTTDVTLGWRSWQGCFILTLG